MSDERLRLMAVHAHPDDESSKGAATMARYVDEGVDVLVVTCTGGERGSILNPALQNRPEIEANISEIRRAEMDHARAILGVEQTWLGFVDSGLPEGDPLPPLPEGCFALAPLEECVTRLVAEIRRFRPHVVTTYNEQGGYPHPDHVRCHEISVAAFDQAPDAEALPEAGEPWQPLKLYYDVGWSEPKMAALESAILAAGLETPFEGWRERRAEWAAKFRPPEITTRVRVGDWFERRDQALLAHATQVDPNGWFFSVPLDIQRAAWPTEDFELARSYVDSTLPEDDLFAGVREKVSRD
ncbi:MAG: mycothiol S-conjugate amidase [Pseudonocardiales bacterium]|nr:mycothiol S-conjugate amidase [Pseudonocardiales bacterium]